MGRGALFWSIKILNLGKKDNILVPAYHCGVDVESILMAGVKVKFYNIKEDLSVDCEDIDSNIDKNTKAVIITHYYGFPQSIDKIRDICYKNSIILIEDCAHALFSIYREIPLGLFGDIAIFSQRKSLPIPDGGSIIINNSNIKMSLELIAPSEIVTLKKTIGMLYNTKNNADRQNALSDVIKIIKNKINKKIIKEHGNTYLSGMEIDINICNLAMSNISRHLMNCASIDNIINKRRHNYQYLAEHMLKVSNIEMVYPVLYDGVCPLFFPIKILNKTRLEAQKFLVEQGIHTYIFGEKPHKCLSLEKYGIEKKLSEEILCIPVHQNIDDRGVEIMVDVLKKI